MGKWSLISLMPDSDWEDEILTRLKEEEERSRHRHLQLPALGAVCWVAGPKKGQGCESPAWRSAWKKTQLQEKTLESSMDCKEIQPVHPKGNSSWIFIGRTDAEVETPILWPPDSQSPELTHCKRPWCWERLKAGWEGDDRGWDGWMVSPTRWTWVWVNSGSWWWTGRTGVFQSMGSQRVGHDWTELNVICALESFIFRTCFSVYLNEWSCPKE